MKAFDGAQVDFVSASSDFSKIVVLVEGGKFGYRYQLIDLVKPGVTSIGKVYAGIDNPLEVRRITYAAADGLEIAAYLTLPRGREAHKLPLIVFPHGGPAAFDTKRHSTGGHKRSADQGYAVLQPNYRGSNVTERLLEAGYGQWGRKMQTDLQPDGVRGNLGKEGIVDATKVCIVGAALWRSYRSTGGSYARSGCLSAAGDFKAIAGLSDLAQSCCVKRKGVADLMFGRPRLADHWGVAFGVHRVYRML